MYGVVGRLTAVSMMAIGIMATAPSANATLFTFHDNLNGANEVPPTGSPFFGTLDATYDDVTKVFDFRFVYSGGGPGDIEDGHIHGPAPVGAEAPILFDFSLFAGAGVSEPRGPFPQPDYEAVIDMDSAIGTSLLGAVGLALTGPVSFESFLLSENLYVNIHTTTFPDGENRAQFLLVDQVPEPATMVLFGMGLIGFAATRRKA